MSFRDHVTDHCPVNPAAPVFFILADGLKRFEQRAGNLYWGDEIPQARIVGYSLAEEHPAVRLAEAALDAGRYALAEGWAALQDDAAHAAGMFNAARHALGAAFDLVTDLDAADFTGEHGTLAEQLYTLEGEADRGVWRACLRGARQFKEAKGRTIRLTRWDEFGGWEAA